MTPVQLAPPAPVVLLAPPVRAVTPWFDVSMDGWEPPPYSGWYEWRRISDGGIDRLWFDRKTTHVMAVGGYTPPLVWNAWRGLQ